jgi:hypothetical protein
MELISFGRLLISVLIAVSLVFGIVIGVLAMRKGYSFAAWLGSGGLVLLSAIALGFLPDLRNPSLSDSQRDKLRAQGNLAGFALSMFTLALAFLSMLSRLLSFPVSGDADRSEFFTREYVPASEFLTWIQALTLFVALAAYLTRLRGRASYAVVGSLVLLLLTQLYFSIVPIFERTEFIREIPVQIVYSSHYFVRVVSYFGIAGLCAGLCAARPMIETPAS